MSKRILSGEEREEESEEETIPTPSKNATGKRNITNNEDSESEEERGGEERTDEERRGEESVPLGFASDVTTGMGTAASTAADALSTALFDLLRPKLEAISDRLVELQEAQHMLVTTVSVQRTDLADGNSEWQNARAVLDKLPEYITKVQRIKKTMLAAQNQIIKVDKASAILRVKLEEKERERAAKRVADASGYSVVSAK